MNIARCGRSARRLGAVLAAAVLTVGATLAVVQPAYAADESISVNFSGNSGTPTYRASGWIYGMTENGANPPDRFFTGVKYRYMRAGGAQLDSPGGWVSGRYDRRWNATRAQLLRTRSLGGEFVLLVHDLWGADGFAISRFPGDNGNWTDYDNFLTRLIDDVRATGAPVQWDLWNEPNITLFWNRSQSQYFELWRRTYQRVRAAFPSHLIVGPSCACVPSTGGWWVQYLDFVRGSNTVPDIISWHSLPGDPVSNVATANTTLDSRGIAHPRPYQINEYGASNQQNPADGAWYIARLERAGADGLRANWASGGNLHNDLGNLLVHDSAGQYQPKGEWWAYNFYASQTGQIVPVTPSANYDGFATKADGQAKVLVGGGTTTGNVAVGLQRLDATTGIIRDNKVRVVVQRIPYNGGGAVAGPVTVQDSVLTVSNNAATVNLPHTNVDDTFTITLSNPGDTPPPPAGRQIVGGQSGRCVDVPDSTTTNGTQVQLWDCGTASGQRWTVTSGGQLSAYNGAKCLDASGGGTGNGTAVVIGDCTSTPSQQWTVNANGTITGAPSGRCLDATGAGTGNGTKLILWSCNGQSNQQWSLRG